MANGSRSPFWKRPGTRPGWWAVGLAAAFLILSFVNSAVLMQMPDKADWQRTLAIGYGFLMMGCGLATAITGLIAILRKGERSWLVWLTILPGAFLLVFLLGEFLVPH